MMMIMMIMMMVVVVVVVVVAVAVIFLAYSILHDGLSSAVQCKLQSSMA